MSKIVITESQFLKLNNLLKEEILTEALQNIQTLLSEHPGTAYILVKTLKGVNTYRLLDYQGGKIIVNDNPNSKYFNWSGNLTDVKVGGDNVYIKYEIDDDHKPVKLTEALHQVTGFQLKDESSNTVYPASKKIFKNKKKNIINKPKPIQEPHPEQIHSEPESTEAPEDTPESKPESTPEDETQLDKKRGLDVYNYIMNDPTIRKAFYHEPKLLGLIKIGDPVGIVPAEQLINNYTQQKSGKEIFKLLPLDSVWNMEAIGKDIDIPDSDFKILFDVVYENLTVVPSELGSDYVTLTHEADEDNPKFRVFVYKTLPYQKDVFKAKVELYTNDGYKHQLSKTAIIRLFKPQG
jgi:hypothetical protein